MAHRAFKKTNKNYVYLDSRMTGRKERKTNDHLHSIPGNEQTETVHKNLFGASCPFKQSDLCLKTAVNS
jgi:hypothetical protein